MSRPPTDLLPCIKDVMTIQDEFRSHFGWNLEHDQSSAKQLISTVENSGVDLWTVFRPLYKQFYWILVADVLILGYMGAMPAEGLYLLIARVATAYYFLHFLVILPVLGFKEKTLPIPLSITEPVLGGSPNLAMAKNKESIDK